MEELEEGEVMEEERRIVVAVDESAESSYALKWCLDNFLSAHSMNVIFLLHVQPPPPIDSTIEGAGHIFSDEVVLSINKYQNDLAKSVLNKARNIINQHHHNHKIIEVREKTMSGDPRHVICDMVKKVKAELLVVGSHGYGVIRRTLLGSVSDHCLRNATCPVMIVKHSVNSEEEHIGD